MNNTKQSYEHVRIAKRLQEDYTRSIKLGVADKDHTNSPANRCLCTRLLPYNKLHLAILLMWNDLIQHAACEVTNTMTCTGNKNACLCLFAAVGLSCNLEFLLHNLLCYVTLITSFFYKHTTPRCQEISLPLYRLRTKLKFSIHLPLIGSLDAAMHMLGCGRCCQRFLSSPQTCAHVQHMQVPWFEGGKKKTFKSTSLKGSLL